MPRSWLLALVASAGLALAACATIPKGRYGVDELTLVGTKQIDPYALRACLATQEREWLSMNLSKDPAPTCGTPPFDARRLHLNMWRWPWTEWPLYDPSIFERDLSRIERWYRARGYYGVRIMDVRSEPEVGLYGTRSDKNKISLRVEIDEGDPVLIGEVQLAGIDALPFALRRELDKIRKDLLSGQRFDEADYDLTRERLARQLRDEGYAQAVVDGRVDVDPQQKRAQIVLTIASGPVMEVGDVCLEGYGKLPAKLILQASDLRPGRPFSQSDLEDARTRVYQLRVLSEVEIIAGTVDPKTGANRFDDDTREGEWLAWKTGEQGQTRVSADDDEVATDRVCRLAKAGKSKRPRVPIEIRVKPGKLYRFGVGAGLQIGVEDGQRAISAAQQWDVHVFAYAEIQNFLGGLRRLRIEERPKLIFLAPFPRLEDSSGNREDVFRLGNNLSVLLEWPAFIEARTMLRLVASWDRGPDPYGGKFIRDDFNIGLGPSRGFLKNRLNASVMVYVNPYIPRSTYGATDAGTTTVLSDERYDLLFLQQVIDWDTRDDKASARRGTYARLELQETLPPSSWGYVRVAPEVRQYIPLPYGLVLAGRAGLGWLQIYNTDAMTEELRRLGPRPYRLRGGGPYSVRGVQAGELGMRNEHDGYFPGGTRSWIASLELRIPLGDSFGIATFIDVGDVDGGAEGQDARFRFNHPNTTLGAGLRYKTLVGPIRLDVGFLVPGLQGPRDDSDQVNYDDPLFRFAGAVHLAVGEAF